MKRILIAVGALLLVAGATAAGAAETRLGSVDVQKVLLVSDAGKDAKEQLSVKAAKYQAEVSAKEEELKKLSGELEKQSVLLSETARGAKEKDFMQKRKEFERLKKDAQDDLQAKNDELTNKIVEEIIRIIQDYGRKNGFTLILVKNESMIFIDDKVDLTDEILKQFNAVRKSAK